eukprot:8181805-Pyramimonas_sp.AAC.1
MEGPTNQLMRTKNDSDPTEHWKVAECILIVGGGPSKCAAIYLGREDTEGSIINAEQHLCEERLAYFASVEQARAQPPEDLTKRYTNAA